MRFASGNRSHHVSYTDFFNPEDYLLEIETREVSSLPRKVLSSLHIFADHVILPLPLTTNNAKALTLPLADQPPLFDGNRFTAEELTEDLSENLTSIVERQTVHGLGSFLVHSTVSSFLNGGAVPLLRKKVSRLTERLDLPEPTLPARAE